MILACEIYQYPYETRKEIIGNILSLESSDISRKEKEVLKYMSLNEKVDFGGLLLESREAAIEFFEALSSRDAEKYIVHLRKTGQATYIKCFERFVNEK